MKTAMMQPTFLPWQGMFELIYNADKFIFLDDFQLSVQSHHARNKLFVNKNQVEYYNVPIQKSKCFEQPLNKTLIADNKIWKQKILKRLSNVYPKSPYFGIIYPLLEDWLTKNYTSLAELNISGIKLFCDFLDIKTTFLFSSEFSKETNSLSKRTQRIIDLIEWSKGDIYLCANGSFEYMYEDNYDYKKYPVLFQNFQAKPYKQIHSQEFIPCLSILDALFNIGAEETLKLVKNGTEKWLTFENMLNLKNNKT